MKEYPIPGVQTVQYRNGRHRAQRCSKCHTEQADTALVLARNHGPMMVPIMVGNDLVGILCTDCVPVVESLIQRTMFPDGHAFPFVDERGELLETPRCEKGHPLVFADDGRSMVCTREDEHDESVRDTGAEDCCEAVLR